MFSLSSIAAVGQSVQPETIKLDTITKVIGILITIGGFFMGYMQMKLSSKLAEVEARLNIALQETKVAFTTLLSNAQGTLNTTIHSEIEKQEAKFALIVKEMQTKMVTVHDINNFKQIVSLQYENIKQQLETAAIIYKKDN